MVVFIAKPTEPFVELNVTKTTEQNVQRALREHGTAKHLECYHVLRNIAFNNSSREILLCYRRF